MTLTYLFHSGFVLETERAILIFDYWMDPAHVISSFFQHGKPLYVFASHFHEDHFNPEILDWKNQCEHTTYILSKDILRHKRAEREVADVWMVKGSVYNDDNITVYATGSNDSGVSWIVDVEGRRIFHAGDLNNWYARFLTDDYKGGSIFSREFGEVNPLQQEKLFLGELKDVRKIADSFDVVMFPIDARIGNGYTRGARQFIERFRVGMFVPMHFVASGFHSAWRMMEFTAPLHIPFWQIKRAGETIALPA